MRKQEVSAVANKVPAPREELLKQLLDADVRLVNASVRWDKAKKEVSEALQELTEASKGVTSARNNFSKLEYGVTFSDEILVPLDSFELENGRTFRASYV